MGKNYLKSEESNRSILKIFSILLSLLFFVFGIISIVHPDSTIKILNIPAGDSIKWFALSIIIFLFPFFKEISFNGSSVKLIDEIRETKKSMDVIVQQISNQKTKSREELIKAYRRYLNLLEEDERRFQVLKLTEIYFEEMNANVIKVKKALIKQGFEIKDETDEINLELIKALEKFQIKQGLVGDGIFGYWTYDKLRAYFDEN